jgi:nicotinate-nucleotide adenylyltransferase
VARLGVFGGTFDPIHMGHLILAGEAVERLRLTGMLFMPASRPAHKRRRSITPVEQRVRMLRLAIRGDARFRVSTLEADRGGINYTAHTLEKIAGSTGRRALYFLMGQDSLEEFSTWRDPERIARLAKLVVLPRGLGRAPRIPSPLRGRAVVLASPRIEISSTEIRKRLRRGLSVRHWLPDRVLAHIQRHGLYGTRRR